MVAIEPGRDMLSCRQTFCVLLQAFDAEEFGADRLLMPFAGRFGPLTRVTSEHPAQYRATGCARPRCGRGHEPTRRNAFSGQLHGDVLLVDEDVVRQADVQDDRGENLRSAVRPQQIN
jgi:hypothetical protein